MVAEIFFPIPVWLACVAILILVFWLSGKSTFNTWSKQGIPGPKPIPWLGNNLGIFGKKKFLYYKYLIEKYGKVVGLYAGRSPVLLVTDPELLNEILIKQFHKFSKRGTPIDVPYLERGLLFCELKEWKRLRPVVNPAFTSSKLKEMAYGIQKCNESFVAGLEKYASSGGKLDVKRMFRKFTMKVLLHTAFGVGQADEDDCSFVEIADEAFRFSPLIFGLLFCFPFLKFFLRSKVVPKSLHRIAEAAKQIIKFRQKIGQPLRRDLLANLMLTEDEKGDGKFCLSDEEVIGQSVTFIFAGSKTTSDMLTFLCYELARNPDVQEKLLAEVDAINKGSTSSHYDVINKAVYLDAVLKETMRLYPTAYRFTRVCTEDCIIKGIRIPKDTGVVVPVFGIQRDPEYWSEPECFNPDRFFVDGKITFDPLHYLPFGVGPRHCIGQRLAILESKLLMVEILKNYSFESYKSAPPLELFGRNSLEAKGEVNLRVVKRHKRRPIPA